MKALHRQTLWTKPASQLRVTACSTRLHQSKRAAKEHKLKAACASLASDVQGASTLQDSLQPNHSAPGKCPFSSTQLTLPQQDTLDEPLADGNGPLGLSVSLPSRDYLPFKDEAYKIDLKFDRISLSDIFEIDEHYEADMQRKAHILATRPAGLILPGVPGSNIVKQEALEVAIQVLIKSFPDRFKLIGQTLLNMATGDSFDTSDVSRNPMDVVARLVQEDVAVMQWIDGKMILSCGAVVGPLGWSASHKLGMDLRGIHDPVPHFNHGPALKFVSKIFEKGLRPGVPLARANWFIVNTDEHSLFADTEHIPPQPDLGPVTLDNAGDRLFLRCERQVTTRLPKSKAVMFTFRTYIRPLRVLKERTEVMQRLLAAFTALPDDVVMQRLLAAFTALPDGVVMLRLLAAFTALPNDLVAYRHIDVNTRQMAIRYLGQISSRHS